MSIFLFTTENREPKTNDLLVALGEEMDANAYCSPGLGLVYKNNIAERRNAVKSRSKDDAIEWEIFLLAGTVFTPLSWFQKGTKFSLSLFCTIRISLCFFN